MLPLLLPPLRKGEEEAEEEEVEGEREEGSRFRSAVSLAKRPSPPPSSLPSSPSFVV